MLSAIHRGGMGRRQEGGILRLVWGRAEKERLQIPSSDVAVIVESLGGAAACCLGENI